jgi:hypothetical protein
MNDDIDDILDSIFDVIDLPDARIKDKLRQGLARGLQVATELGQDVKVELVLDPGSPDVVVLDGGREPTGEVERASADASEPRSDDTIPEGRPTLSVHHREECEDIRGLDDFDDDFDAMGDFDDYLDDFEELRAGGVRVKVVDSRARGSGDAPVGAGRIDVSDDVQTLFRGANPAIYRVYCEDGELTVRLDGRSVETLSPGQSMDVESRRVQVEGDGEGWYLKV